MAVLAAPLLLAACAGAPPQIVALSPPNGRGGIPVDFAVGVTFDHAVDRGSVAERFRIAPPLQGCAPQHAFGGGDPGCRVVWSADSTSMTLQHGSHLFVPDTKYHVSLDGGFRDGDGVANGLDHSWELTTATAPTLGSSTPGDGSTDVPTDAAISLGFSALMGASATGAIRLDPAVPGTRIALNARDHSRAVVIPGHLLAARTTYTVTVSTGAHEEHGASLAAPARVRFTTGTLGSAEHAAVLVGPPGEPATEVRLPGGFTPQPGDPVADPVVLSVPRCDLAACGAVTAGQPTEAFLAARPAPRGSLLAVVVADLAAPASGPRLELVDLDHGTVDTVAAGASLVSWSHDGGSIAYALGGAVEVRSVSTGAVDRLPAGDPLVAPPVWSADGSALALTARGSTGVDHVELADIGLRARYPLPGGIAAADSPAFSPDGTRVAVRRGDGTAGTWLVGIRTADAAPRLVGAGLAPLSWIDGSTLLAVDRPGAGAPALVQLSITTGDVVHLAGLPAAALDTVTTTPTGRTVAYLQPDARGLEQAFRHGIEGGPAAQLTDVGAADGTEAAAVCLSD